MWKSADLRSEDMMDDMPPAGNTKETSLPGLLIHLNRKRKTGTFVVKTPLFVKKIYFVKGDAIFASSTYEDDRLGEMLLKAGKITLEQYDESVELLKTTGKRQGSILVELRYLTPKDLFWGVKYQVKEIISSVFLLENAGYEFIEGEVPAHEVITLKMSMGNLIYEGVKRIDNWTRIRKEMPGTETVLKLSCDPVSIFQDIELSQQDRKILSLVDGTKTIKELIDSAWIGSFEAMKTLYVLWSIGILEEQETMATFEKPEISGLPEETFCLDEMLQSVSESEDSFIRKVDERYSTLDGASPHELLEVNDHPDEETLKKNYYRLTKEFHPDRYLVSSDVSVKDKLTAIFDAITKAYEHFQNKENTEERSVQAEESIEISSQEASEEHFKRGIEFFKKEDYWAARDSFSWSTRLNPQNARYWSYYSLSMTKLPGMMTEAENAILEAIKLEPGNVSYYINLGTIYLKSGKIKRAHSQFEKALKLDPSSERARQGLRKTKP
jgi:tetratricopeptide (TPR) repeat protein